MSLMDASQDLYPLENAMMIIGFQKQELKFKKELKNIHNLKLDLIYLLLLMIKKKKRIHKLKSLTI